MIHHHLMNSLFRQEFSLRVKTFNIDEEDTFSTWELNKTYLNKKYGLSVRLVQDVK